ncbi:PepSY-associated TM helix domain-containing protein [Thiomicrorhabdus sp.]|uniref:PepSY-associated TM helix domain-containing protein n=1 Tax=Thiomicrorhabdus sp. TaxID=2039724 RepID=UPI0029C769BD|nr:PepSY-associated TM helix domain-containing protein [Thiomicrorhabdus sp.]
MNTDVLRVYKSIHTWTGILAGLALFIAFYAGALTIFKEPISQWASAPGPGVEAVPLKDVNAVIAYALETEPKAAKDLRVHLIPSESLPGRVSFEVPGEGADDHNQLAYRHFIATVEADGKPIVQEAHPTQVAELIDVLHRVVGLPFDTDENRWIMGVVALLYAVALVSGLIIFLPNMMKNFFALRQNKGPRRKWLDAHNVVGIFSLPFHLVIVFTSVVFAYHDGLYGIQNQLIHDGNLRAYFAADRPKVANHSPVDPKNLLPPETLAAKAVELSPTFKPTMLQYVRANSPQAMVRVWGNDDTAVAPRAWGGFVILNPYTGEVLTQEYLPNKQSAASTTLSSFFALHFATYGGTAVQWIYFFLGLAGAWLFYSGNLLWIENRRKVARLNHAQPIQRRDTYWMASATVGVCVGAVAGISAAIVASKWLHGFGESLTVWHQSVYYGVFFASIFWAFFRGGAKASVELLLLAAILTLAIPFTSLLAWLVPSSGLWVYLDSAALGVDLTALAGGGALLWMAKSAYRRAYCGTADSVWSANAVA